MGDLHTDSELVAAEAGTFSRRLSRDWEIWGPNGGYLASLALNAARITTGRARPANATVHFLGVASFDTDVTITTEIQRATRQATSVSVRIHQDGKPVLAAMVWGVDDAIDGLVHDDAPPPDVPHWRDLMTVPERLAAAGIEEEMRYPFWGNFEVRPPEWVDDWASRVLSRPLYLDWIKFRESGVAADAWDQAARLMLLVDLGGWPAIGRAHRTEEWMAPTIDVSCEFHRPNTGDEWFLLQGESPHAGDGLVATHQHVWNDSGQLLASGVSHLLCRRVA